MNTIQEHLVADLATLVLKWKQFDAENKEYAAKGEQLKLKIENSAEQLNATINWHTGDVTLNQNK